MVSNHHFHSDTAALVVCLVTVLTSSEPTVGLLGRGQSCVSVSWIKWLDAETLGGQTWDSALSESQVLVSGSEIIPSFLFGMLFVLSCWNDKNQSLLLKILCVQIFSLTSFFSFILFCVPPPVEHVLLHSCLFFRLMRYDSQRERCTTLCCFSPARCVQNERRYIYISVWIFI